MKAVMIARCPEHGLHGERAQCFVCGGPVEQVPMVPARLLDGARRALETCARETSLALGRAPSRRLIHQVATEALTLIGQYDSSDLKDRLRNEDDAALRNYLAAAPSSVGTDTPAGAPPGAGGGE